MEKEPQPHSRAVVYVRVNRGAVGSPDAAAMQVECQRDNADTRTIVEAHASSQTGHSGCTLPGLSALRSAVGR